MIVVASGVAAEDWRIYAVIASSEECLSTGMMCALYSGAWRIWQIHWCIVDSVSDVCTLFTQH